MLYVCITFILYVTHITYWHISYIKSKKKRITMNRLSKQKYAVSKSEFWILEMSFSIS